MDHVPFRGRPSADASDHAGLRGGGRMLREPGTDRGIDGIDGHVRPPPRRRLSRTLRLSSLTYHDQYDSGCTRLVESTDSFRICGPPPAEFGPPRGRARRARRPLRWRLLAAGRYEWRTSPSDSV